MKQVTIFCASSNRVDSKYYAATEELGKILVQNGISILYGGGKEGLMGRLAETVMKEKGKIAGVLPEFMQALNWHNPDISELIWTKDMSERKQILISRTEAIICLPGGYGTLDELLEVITLKQLGQFLCPIIILNTDGYFNPLISMFQKMRAENFMREMHLAIWKAVDLPSEVIPAILNFPSWDSGKAAMAQV
jgi:uncharacterized protein (TIGR00730 family)